MFFFDCEFDGHLSPISVGPVRFDGLAAVLNLDECSAGFVTGTPNRHQVLARLHRPTLGGDFASDCDGKLGCLRVEHSKRHFGSHGLTRIVRRFENSLVRSGAELRRRFGKTFAVGFHLLGFDDITQRP